MYFELLLSKSDYHWHQTNDENTFCMVYLGIDKALFAVITVTSHDKSNTRSVTLFH